MSEELSKGMPSVLDREIGQSDADAFGHRHFAEALRSLIEAPSHEPPYSIGLLGGWGTGKSTIKTLYTDDLVDDATRVDGKKRSERIHVVTFNAWRFGGEDIKRALLRHVFLELGGNRHTLQDALFRHVERVANEVRPWREVLADLADRWLFGLAQIVVPLVLLGAFLVLLHELVPEIDPNIFGAVVVLSLSALGYILKQFFSSASFLVAARAPTKRIEMPQTAAEQYEDLLLQQIQEFARGKGRGCERLVVFVDDLDRLSAEEMVTGLDAVRTFLEIPKAELPPSLGLIFVISCDEDRVAQAIAGKQRRLGSTELPGSVFNLGDARRFLDRIFQFRLELPSFPQRDMRSFAEEKMRSCAPGIVSSVEAMGVSIDNVVDRMIHPGIQSPRNAVQIVNAFVQSFWLASRRELEGAGTAVTGGLGEGTVTRHPISLAALCALRVDFPDFFADLQEDPELISRVERVAFRGGSLSEEPTTTIPVVGKYLDTDKKRFRDEYRPLRQFLASLQGLRWPPSLQAHLQLAQDPWTRRLGDGATRLQEAFVLGDTRGVLEELGRSSDERPLQVADCRKLRDLFEGLYWETTARQNNAASVLADLRQRLPAEEARSLMSPLARRLADSETLRWRVGVGRMRAILEFATSDDRRFVGQSLVSDFCRSGEDISFRLETGGSPSIDEAVQMTSTAVEICLWINSVDGLSAKAKDVFLDWLATREIAVGGKQQSLPFSLLERWVAEFEESLKAEFSDSYLELVSSQLEADDLEGFDPSQTVERAFQFLRRLDVLGEEGRCEVWKVVPRLAAVRFPESASASGVFLREHFESLDPEPLSRTVASLAVRAEKRFSDEDWALVDNEIEESLALVCRTRVADLQEEAVDPLRGLLKTAGRHDELAEFAGSVVASFVEEGIHGDVLSTWSEGLLSWLSMPLVRRIGKEFATLLDEEARAAVVNALQAGVIGPDNVGKTAGERYREFMAALARSGAETAEMKQHLSALVQAISSRHNNPNNYLYSVFAGLPRHGAYCDAGQLGDMLQTLFVQARSDPTLFGFLHSWMRAKWPKKTEATKTYDPDILFAQAIEFLSQQAGNKNSGHVLLSLSSMSRAGVVAGKKEALVDAACGLWLDHRQDAVQVVTSNNVAPSPEKTAELGASTVFEQSDEVDHLREAWSSIAEAMSTQERAETLATLLSTQEEDESYRAIDLWLAVQADDGKETLEDILRDDELTDAVKARGWKAAERKVAELGCAFYTALIPALLGRADAPATTRAVLDAKEPFAAALLSGDEKHQLGEALLRGLLVAASRATKNELAVWLRSLDGQALVRRVADYGEATVDDVEALTSAFPEERRRLAKLLPKSE